MSKPFPAQATSNNDSIVGPSVTIQGDLITDANIRIEGQVQGKVRTTQNLYVGPEAKIRASIQAGNATIGGEIVGNIITTKLLVLESTAKIKGDITCGSLQVETGAIFNGNCKMVQEEVRSSYIESTIQEDSEEQLEEIL
jgi:cytoskeletal protein CcmA (bactofilin family)